MAMCSNWQSTINPDGTAFFLDVDGTLLGFKPRPEEVVADDDLVTLMQSLNKRAGGAVALVSGRMISDLDRIFDPLTLPAGGVHGADIRFADGERRTADAAALAKVRSLAGLFVDERPGLRLEDKHATIAVHFRAAPERDGEVARFLEDAIEGEDLMIQHGKMVAEVKSSSSHKGAAIQTFMETPPFRGRIPLFIGDDLTDEHGFESVNAMGGVSIKVGSDDEETVAHHRVADPRAVRDLLKVICRTTETFV